MNGILASLWGLATEKQKKQWAPDFYRVPSEANISDAVCRGDDSAARRHGWTPFQAPVDEVMWVLGRAATDIDFACHVEVRTPAPGFRPLCLAGRRLRHDQTEGHCAPLGSFGLASLARLLLCNTRVCVGTRAGRSTAAIAARSLKFQLPPSPPWGRFL